MTLASVRWDVSTAVRDLARGLITAWLAAGCHGSIAIEKPVTCGPGTTQEGDICIANSAIPGGGSGAASPAGGAGAAGFSAASGSDDPSCNAGGSGAGGTSGGASGELVPIDGSLQEILVDPREAHIYVSNHSKNQIEDYSLAAGALQPPIPVGSRPSGFGITPNGRLMYVANTGENSISVVDLATRHEVRKINVPPGASNDTPFSLAIAANGKALFSTSGRDAGRMMSLDLATDTVTEQVDSYFNAKTGNATFLKASADRSTIAAVEAGLSAGPVFVYSAATGVFFAEHDLNALVSNVAVNSNGTMVMVDGGFILDGNLNLLVDPGLNLPPSGPHRIVGGAFDPSDVAFTAGGSEFAGGWISVETSPQFTVYQTFMIADGVNGSCGSRLGNMAVTSKDKLLAVITGHGITIYYPSGSP